uniref:NADH-ubiquinone oxidoreductase chain 2 n=1 Tax=Psammotettix sp. EMHAU-2015-Zz053036 TaxID=2038643 RepID=A0A343K600_9HEMI|nr:NADH dehydrogenase subunit 2 [Psammotettix sp. EMHAU-2015-Zz053036]
MFSNLTKLTLTNTMMIGVIMVVCSNNWLSMWMGLELSMLSFIPLMQNKFKTSSEAMIKYFIVQSAASTMFLFSVIYMLIGVNIMNEMIMTMAMLIKLGSAPFHNWMIIMIEMIDFQSMFVLLTVMKLPALSIMYQINSSMLIIPIIISMIISSISCINQTSIRKTLGYSSIFNISLMMTSINKINIMFIYLLAYSIMLGMMIYIMKSLKINFINQMVFNEFSYLIKINIWINMLSMGGFPPTTGFLVKILILQNISMNMNMLIIWTFILTSLITMMFYTRLAFSSILSSSSYKKWIINKNKTNYSMMAVNIIFPPVILTLTSIL